MWLARRADNDPLTESGPAAKAGDVTSGWLSSGTGLRNGGQRGGLGALKTRARARTVRVGRIKGVKRL
jgi:L-aminopeptidase/D-esterase-like protein